MNIKSLLLLSTMTIASTSVFAHDPVPPTPAVSIISQHSLSDNIYIGYGPAWNTSFSGWNQARTNATNNCLAAGNPVCNFSVAAWDHCTFWGEGEFVHGAPRGEPGFTTPSYLCISHPPEVLDSDGDGVNNDDDLCPDTDVGSLIDTNGCSGPQVVESDCPVTGDYKNHGKYMSCVSSASGDAQDSGLLTNKERSAIVSAAAKSDVGKK